MSLSKEQAERYLRNTMLPGVGDEGQEKLLAGKVLVVGTGGLGSPVCMYLAAAGGGTIGIIDSDIVDRTNLQRQIIHTTDDLGRAKVLSAKETMQSINPDVTVVAYEDRFTGENSGSILADYDFVIDAVDNFESKFLIADECYKAGKPAVQGGILEFEGQVMTVLPGETACYRCVFDSPPEKVPPPAGVMGVLPGIIGTIQATEAVKYLLGMGNLLADRLVLYDALNLSFREIRLTRNPDCSLCS
ncbi:adenylyltransferase [bacterium B17]|nr:adenylyltransferase [bacterium B17]